MRTTGEQAASGILALALSMLLVPAAVQAQEEGQQAEGQQQECTAQVTPETVEAGQSAVRVEVSLSSSVGHIQAFRAAGEGGVKPAAPEAIGKMTQEMAREEGDQPPQPVEMAAEGGSGAFLWLNTEDAAPGQYQLILQGESGTCTATVGVTESAAAGEEGES